MKITLVAKDIFVNLITAMLLGYSHFIERLVFGIREAFKIFYSRGIIQWVEHDGISYCADFW